MLNKRAFVALFSKIEEYSSTFPFDAISTKAAGMNETNLSSLFHRQLHLPADNPKTTSDTSQNSTSNRKVIFKEPKNFKPSLVPRVLGMFTFPQRSTPSRPEGKSKKRPDQASVTVVDGEYEEYFTILRELGHGNQGKCLLALPFNVIPRKAPVQLSENDLDHLRNCLRVVKIFHQKNGNANPAKEVDVLKSRVVHTLSHSSRLTSQAADCSWFASTWAGMPLEDIMNHKDRFQWYLPSRILWELLYQILKALAHLHTGTNGTLSVHHSDIVSTNITLQIVKDAGQNAGKPRLHVNLIDFGWAEEFDPDSPLHKVSGAQRDLQLLAENVHYLAHPENYEFDDTQPIYNEVDRTYCHCWNMLKYAKTAERLRLRDNYDADLIRFLDLFCKPGKMTSVNALSALTTKYAAKLKGDYDIPGFFARLVYAHTPSNKEIRDSLEHTWKAGQMSDAAASAAKMKKPIPKNYQRPRIYLPTEDDRKRKLTPVEEGNGHTKKGGKTNKETETKPQGVKRIKAIA